MNFSLLQSAKLALAAFASLAIACAPATDSSDLPFEEGNGNLGKADAVSLEFTAIQANIENDRRQDGGKAIITSADSWLNYFGTDAPADIDWDNQWVAFFGSGLRNTGGYGASITGLSQLPSGGLVLSTVASSPGFDCIVTQALTTPHMIVAFDIPSPTPRWAVSDHEDVVNRCGPTQDERRAELAASLETWTSARDSANNSYTYVRQTAPFFANTTFTTTFVVENGVVVERNATSGFSGEEPTNMFTETGDDVGNNVGVHPVAIIDDLYAQCDDEVLSLDDSDHFINLTVDGSGLLRTCTSFHRNCQDDCSRGPVISSIEF